MKCHDARRLFGPYWDDECTQAEREWLEAHFSSCAPCRHDYEDQARVLETMAALPRYEASPELLERTLARIRHVSPAPDRLPERRTGWVPATAAAALLILGGALVLQWTATMRGPLSSPDRVATKPEISQVTAPVPVAPPTAEQVAAAVPSIPDSLFDHSEDVEFVLDPVTLKRGRATVTRELPNGVRTEQAVVSF